MKLGVGYKWSPMKTKPLPTYQIGSELVLMFWVVEQNNKHKALKKQNKSSQGTSKWIFPQKNQHKFFDQSHYLINTKRIREMPSHTEKVWLEILSFSVVKQLEIPNCLFKNLFTVQVNCRPCLFQIELGKPLVYRPRPLTWYAI